MENRCRPPVDHTPCSAVIENIEFSIHHRVLDEDVILAGSEVLRISGFKFEFVRIIRISVNRGNLYRIIPNQPDLQTIVRVTGCNTMGKDPITV